MIRWDQVRDIPDNYDGDPTHEYAHKVNDEELKAYRSGKRSTVTAVCTKKWAPSNDRRLLDMPLCPHCFPKRFTPAMTA